MKRFISLLLTIVFLGACGATTKPTLTGEAADVIRQLAENNAPISNLRVVTLNRQRAAKLSDSKGFDIPGVKIPDAPAGVVEVYKDEKEARFNAQLSALVGGPGLATRQPFVERTGNVNLVLDYRLDPKLAEVYFNAFRAIPIDEALPDNVSAPGSP